MVGTIQQFHAARKPKPRAFPYGQYMSGVFERSDIPGTVWAWKGVFREWVAEQFYENRENGADLFPEVGTRQHTLQTLLDLAAIKRPFDLSDANVYSLFQEYLTENPTRLDWWRRFLLLNGPCDTL